MLKFVLVFVISVWTTSSLFMVGFWLNATIAIFRENGKIFLMPIGSFLYIHFCPIVHTIQCFKIMQRAIELYEEKRRV